MSIVRARQQDQDVHTSSIGLGPEAFGAARAADYSFTLPVERLPSGPYLLTCDARLEVQKGAKRPANSTARRDVRFVVR